MSDLWTERARESLLQRRVRGSGWGYRDDGDLFVEPTALASLALLAAPYDDLTIAAVHKAADWLAGLQQADGALGLSAEVSTPCWGTSYGVLVWAALDTHRAQRDKAVEWLLALTGKTLPAKKGGVLGHDTSILGWPWVQDTHAWLEPTALAVLALRREGLSDHPRVREGIRLISNRAIRTGGWNYGNIATFGTPLSPQPAPSGMALLALAGLDADRGPVEAGRRYLRQTLPQVRSPRSLSWGLLGLSAWEDRPDQADAWLAESFARISGGSHTAVDLAQLLLASSSRTLDLLGIEAANWRTS